MHGKKKEEQNCSSAMASGSIFIRHMDIACKKKLSFRYLLHFIHHLGAIHLSCLSQVP